jgi:osmoprotectant transport system permease protein
MILTRNIASGFHAIPLDVRDAAQGMGYGKWRNLREVELPLALPFIISDCVSPPRHLSASPR